MRKVFDKNDLILCENAIRLLKRSNFREIDFEEALGAYQTWQWLQGLRKSIEQEVALKDALQSVAKELENGISMVSCGPVQGPEQDQGQAPGRRKASPDGAADLGSGGAQAPQGRAGIQEAKAKGKIKK